MQFKKEKKENWKENKEEFFQKLDGIGKGNYKEDWLPDSKMKSCGVCGKQFTFFKRRHHCRICCKIFCSKCCTEKPYAEGNPIKPHTLPPLRQKSNPNVRGMRANPEKIRGHKALPASKPIARLPPTRHVKIQNARRAKANPLQSPQQKPFQSFPNLKFNPLPHKLPHKTLQKAPTNPSKTSSKTGKNRTDLYYNLHIEIRRIK